MMEDNELPSYEDAIAVEQKEYVDQACRFGHDCFKSPSAPPLPPEAETVSMQDLFSKLTDEEIREACYKHAGTNLEQRSRAIKDIKFTNVYSTFSLHYKLETFTEKRQVTTGYSHYYKQNIDGPKSGPEPDPWSITVELPSHFKDNKVPIIIPHTEHVKTCHQCDGRGKEDCLICEGAGWTYCKVCSSMEPGCSFCRSTIGHLTCEVCNQTGRIECRVCKGYKKLKHHKELIVTWETYIDHSIQKSVKIPDDLLQSSTCKEIFREEGPMVHTLQNFRYLFLITEASSRLIEKHKKISAKDEVIRMQRQTLRAVPVTRVNYEYKGEEDEFYVFGLENSVYFLNTLQNSSGCCIS